MTPITDAAEQGIDIDDREPNFKYVPSKVARELEEELNLYKQFYIKAVENVGWMHSEVALGLPIGASCLIDGVNVLADFWRKHHPA